MKLSFLAVLAMVVTAAAAASSVEHDDMSPRFYPATAKDSSEVKRLADSETNGYRLRR